MQLEILGSLIATILAAVIGGVRYLAQQNAKREKAILDHNEKVQKQIFEYMETKNGHLERISKDFASTNKSVGKSLNKLTKEIQNLHYKLDK